MPNWTVMINEKWNYCVNDDRQFSVRYFKNQWSRQMSLKKTFRNSWSRYEKYVYCCCRFKDLLLLLVLRRSWKICKYSAPNVNTPFFKTLIISAWSGLEFFGFGSRFSKVVRVRVSSGIKNIIRSGLIRVRVSPNYNYRVRVLEFGFTGFRVYYNKISWNWPFSENCT